MSSYAKCLIGGLIMLALVAVAHAQDAHPHVADADREYAAVFSHAENPCQKEPTTLSYNQCIGKEVEFTEQHLNAFLAAVRAIVAGDDAAQAPTEAVGKTKELDLLNKADQAWREYKKNLCQLEFAGFNGGSGASSAESECEYGADRQYVRQIADAILLKILAK